MNQKQKQVLITIEGNIGSGKSTLLKLLKEKYAQFSFINEPVQEWQSIGGNPDLNLLQQFYEQPNRWAYTMQIYALFSRLKHWQNVLELYKANLIQEFFLQRLNPEDQKIILSERSIQADKEIFGLNGKEQQLMDDLEYAIYEQSYDWLVNEIFGEKIGKQLVIYLKTDFEVCHQRLKKRGRAEEKESIPLSYLEQLENRHEQWLNNENLEKQNIWVLKIDGNKEFETELKRQDEIMTQIDSFIKENIDKSE